MNLELVDKIAKAVLYEGYLLYPYRPSVKTRQRWTFGGLYPESYSAAQNGTDACAMQTQVLVQGSERAALTITIRFLHVSMRQAGKLDEALGEGELPSGREPAFQRVDSLELGGKLYQSWQEAVEREVTLEESELNDLLDKPKEQPFGFPHHRQLEPLRDEAGQILGLLVREQQPIQGSIHLAAEHVEGDLFKVTVRIENRTPFADAVHKTRDDALMRALVSTHTILGVRLGEFISLTDPPECYRQAAAGCRNIGTWPVLVGIEGAKDTILSSPIILADYPEIAPESPGDLFDSTEIDEILTLRIMTLTDDEKRQMIATDDRARAILERTESLARQQLMGLHGAMRGLRPISEEANGERQ